MTAKYPEPFPPELDLDAMEVFLRNLMCALIRYGGLQPEEAGKLRAMLHRCSPYARRKDGLGERELSYARWDGWDGVDY